MSEQAINSETYGQAFHCANGSRGHEVHIKDIEGYEQTIAGPGMTEDEAKEWASAYNRREHGA